MPTIEFLRENIDLHDLAERLGWQRPGGRGNYSAPHRDDKTPSVSISADGRYFKDFTGAGKGSCIDMIMYHDQNDSVADAVRRLHDIYGWPLDKPHQADTQPGKASIAEFIASKCRHQADRALDYLTGRGIDENVVRTAIKRGTVGFNDYTNPKYPPGELFHGGPGVAFITKCPDTAKVVGVDIRYIDPDLNGGLKTMSHGDKDTVPWTSDWSRVKEAGTVYFFESAINALSFETCFINRKMAAVATKGTETCKTIDLQFAIGKQCVLCLDNDTTNDDGKCPGPEAAWLLYERLTAMGVAVQLVEQVDWRKLNEKYNDLNDVLQGEGVTDTRAMLKRFEEWAIPGLAGCEFPGRKSRLFLPAHDYAQYWRFRCKPDFTRYIREMRDSDDDSDGTPVFNDLCGFRVASISRITIASASSVMNGSVDHSPVTLFSVSVQTARHGPNLIRRVFEDEKLHNLNHWGKFGSIYMPAQFNRLVDILERGAHLGQRNAINFVGLAWKQGRLVVNEGHDCYFTEPNKQCTYYNLRFPSGRDDQARQVIQAYQKTFGNNAAALILVWALGGHLKALLGFWPHMVIQADKGSGKSVLVNRLESTLAFKMLSGQSLETEFRLLTSCSYTSHPVGWEEISTRGQQIIDKAVSLLQESYQFTVTYRGADLTEFLICAPVLLAGEDVPVRSLTGKIVRAQLAQKGPHIPDDLPAFPVRQWLNFLASQKRDHVKQVFARAQAHINKNCRATQDDPGANRIRENYAAMLTAWKLLCEFAGIESSQGGFITDCLAEMNNHIAESVGDRDPWIWIIEIVLSEISARRFTYPYKFMLDKSGAQPISCLAIRHTHIMQHLRASTHLRDTFNALPIKSNKVLFKQLQKAGVLARERIDITINNHRESHMVALDLDKLGEYGIYTSVPEVLEDMPIPLHAVHTAAGAQSQPSQHSDEYPPEIDLTGF